ncbi:transmembrane protein 232 [Leucoraja erinacea]|uniref:transmembrane protein 232 n=1 Tax=Leucoraja erinaceus TaxID=7782 RepID=UPI0024590A4A|nr:transmembrane protein 232 [Leucoraja erinacea]
MPILKIPIVHRFGIVSQNDHVILEATLAKKTAEALKGRYSTHAAKKPLFEVTEQFVQKFKCAEGKNEKKRMIDLAKKMLTRNKRKVGLSTLGSGDHVNLPVAWAELALLVQCKGKIQEEALDILLISLDHAPLHPDQIPVLFFLAESILYWICTDAVKQSYLYTCEVKITKVGFITFLRLFIFHLAGFIRPFEQCQCRLRNYLKGLPECEPCYRSYPSVLLDIHFIISSGEIICGSQIPTEEHAHESSVSNEEPNKNTCGQQIDEPTLKTCNISPVLRECLMVWICVKHNIQIIDDVLKNLFLKEQLCKANWIDSALGLLLLGESAKINMACLKALKELGINLVTHFSVPNLKEENVSPDIHVWPLQLNQLYCCILGDICLHGSTSEIQKAALTGSEVPSKSTNKTYKPGLIELLQIRLAATAEDDHSWWVRYGASYSLGKICHLLYGDRSREGIRNAAWKALQKHQTVEQDTRVLAAIKVAEAELNGPINPFINTNLKTSSLKQSVSFCTLGWRIASVLSQLCLPPVVPYIPLPRLLPQRPTGPRPPLKRKENVNKRLVRLPLSQEIMLAQAGKHSLPDFNTRTDFDLRRIVEDQWRKYLCNKLEERERDRQLQLQENHQLYVEGRDI